MYIHEQTRNFSIIKIPSLGHCVYSREIYSSRETGGEDYTCVSRTFEFKTEGVRLRDERAYEPNSPTVYEYKNLNDAFSCSMFLETWINMCTVFCSRNFQEFSSSLFIRLFLELLTACFFPWDSFERQTFVIRYFFFIVMNKKFLNAVLMIR